MDQLLIVTADDYGYAPAYDRGIVEAARAQAVDSVSAMVDRAGFDPAPLSECGVEIGLHLELPGDLGAQVERFRALVGRDPAYLDGHKHLHATRPYSVAVTRVARDLQIPVRSVDERHRRTLRCLGVSTPDRLIGRLSEEEPALPHELEEALAGAGLAAGVTEWMTHPGHAASATSSYDAGREEDLRVLLELGDRASWVARGITRATHAEALAHQRPRA